MKPIVILVLALATLGLSLLFQPWAELGFGMNPEDITTKSMMHTPLTELVKGMSGFDGMAKELKTNFDNRLKAEAALNGVATPDPNWDKPVKAGNYAYAWFMAFAMLAASVAIIVIGREDAEEKTVLPVKK